MGEQVIPPPALAALQDLADIFGDHVVLVGALALEAHSKLGDRATLDVDVAITHEIDYLRSRLLDAERWLPDERQAQRWRYVGDGNRPAETLVDILPASPAGVEAGYVELTDGWRLGLVGFRHLLEHRGPIEGLPVAVGAPLSLVLLKMVAFADRPADRVRDLGDIAELLDVYVPPDDDRLWFGEAADRDLFNEDGSAFLLGLDLGRGVSSTEAGAVEHFLALLLDPNDAHHLSRMAAEARGSVSGDAGRARRRLECFSTGFEAGRND